MARIENQYLLPPLLYNIIKLTNHSFSSGYSGVAIYTRQSKISPIKAEEGITGYLTGPSSSTSYISLPTSKQIGGYPTHLTRDEALHLDSEGRAIILDLGAFILIGTYSPANRDSSRDEFRTAFVQALFERCRNLITMGRRVVLLGDLNIARDEIDSAHAREAMSKAGGVSFKELSECRMMFDRLLEPHQEGVMVDVCREWWPERGGMYTCWEQRKRCSICHFLGLLSLLILSGRNTSKARELW